VDGPVGKFFLQNMLERCLHFGKRTDGMRRLACVKVCSWNQFLEKGTLALDYRFTWQRYNMFQNMYGVGAEFLYFIFYKF
jgi:hypothetical protein